MVRCRVVFDDHELEVSVEDEDASIQALVAKARAQLEAQGRSIEMPPTSQLVIHRGRDAKGGERIILMYRRGNSH